MTEIESILLNVYNKLVTPFQAKAQIEAVLKAKYDEGHAKGEKLAIDLRKELYDRGVRDGADRVRDGMKELLGIKS